MMHHNIHAVLRSPHNTEKASNAADKYNQYVFEVNEKASKNHIKRSVEKLFDVKVDSVCTLNVKGKKTKTKGIDGRKNNFKKAYVRLKQGFDINFIGAE